MLCICNKPEYINCFDRKKDYEHHIRCCVQLEFDTKETMPPVGVLPTDALLLKSLKIPPDKGTICGWNVVQVKTICCCHFSFTSPHDKAACKLMAEIIFCNGPCMSLQPVFCSGYLVFASAVSPKCHSMIIDHIVRYISKLTDGGIDSWSPQQPQYSWSSGKGGGQSWLMTGISLIGRRKRCVSNIPKWIRYHLITSQL